MANILITGATGLAGNRALASDIPSELPHLADGHLAKRTRLSRTPKFKVGQVTVITRRELPSDPVRAPYASKLRTLVVPDIGKLDWDSLATEVWWGALDGCLWYVFSHSRRAVTSNQLGECRALGQPFYKSTLTQPEYERMTVDWPYACASRLPKSSNFVFITGEDLCVLGVVIA